MKVKVLGRQAYKDHRSTRTADRWETAGIGALLVVFLAITVTSLNANHFWEPDAPLHAPWCPVGETPTFRFGFSSLAQATGNVMGSPIECEHGDGSSDKTLQATTTGVAAYDWCTNTPSFSRGHEHWMLTPEGVEYWTGNPNSPRPVPVVRAPDLRHLCLT